MTNTQIATEEPLSVSEAALATVLEIRASEDDPAGTALRVGINGSNMTDFDYALDLVPISQAGEGDAVYTQGSHDELTVIVPADSITNMAGATLDVTAAAAGGLVIRNPNQPDPLAGLDLDNEGELPERVEAVLEQAVNPALASHGGYAHLVGVDDTKVFITMGGGCQGCGLAAVTLQQGIEKAILSAVPEITEVVDVTDHSLGANPYF